MSLRPCYFCGSAIGYGKRVFRSALPSELAHEKCLRAAVDADDEKAGAF